MTGVPVGLLGAVAGLSLLLAAALSAGQTAVLRLGRAALGEMVAADLSGTARLRRVMSEPRRVAASAATVRVVLESSVAVCVTLMVASTGLVWWGVVLAAVGVVGAAALTVVRLGPRTLGRHHPGATARVSAGLLLVADRLVGLLRPGGSRPPQDLTDEEVRAMVDRVSESEHIEDDEREMFRSVLELGDTLTRAVMVPRTEMITLAAGTPVRKALGLFLRSGYSRVPVVGETVDEVVGVLYLKDVVRHRHLQPGSDDDPVDPLLRPVVYVPESKPVDELLRDMQQGASHIALVVDEYGGIAGLVTIEDALEEIVGELTDEHDRSGPEVEDLGDGAFRVPARLPVDELGELFDLVLDDDDVDTAGGLLAKALGKVPLVGSQAGVAGLVLTADRVEGRRKQVSTLLVRQAPADDQHHDQPSTTSQGASR
ncbi:CBS domain-containing protein [Actinotalea sp. K2]|uniref:CBS domain-containing protein n=1 Tax=Actinotalea sp. K2 TaxID=2939438 RepID=UPI002017185C|nr:CBS domain-containing protein [Actinotalea sp. K2]MCL3860596.1 CBS domain-containing protein [Actinotalea sp. K2]